MGKNIISVKYEDSEFPHTFRGKDYCYYTNIKLNNDYHETRNLGSDGIVYRGKLNPKESKKFSIKMKIDKDDLTSSDCFYPTIKANTYNEI